MIEWSKIDPADGDAVAAWIGACGGNPLHLPAVHRVQDPDTKIHCIGLEEDGRRVAWILGTEAARGKVGRLLRRSRSLGLPTAPALAPAADPDQVRRVLLDYAREEGFERLSIAPSWGSDLFDAQAEGVVAEGEALAEFVLDLRPDYETVFSTMHKTHRKNVRRGARAGLVVEEQSDLEGLMLLRSMQLSSAERASERAEGFGVPSEEFFVRLHEVLYRPGIGHVLVARLEGEPVATLAWLQVGSRALTVRSGSSAEGYQTRAMYLVYDALIERLIGEGHVELNAGAVPAAAAQSDHPQSGLFEFKQGFGAEPRVRQRLEVALDEVLR